MPEDTTSGAGNANLGPEIKPTFNRDVELQQQLAAASPDAVSRVRVIQEVGATRTEAEKKGQQRNHGYRVLRQEVELLQAYIRNPAPRPPEIIADPSPDLEIIHKEAERMVTDREAYYLRRIEQETTANIQQILETDRHQRGAPARDRNEPEHDR